MRDHQVSVIIPAYNAGACLARCIDSALFQTLKPTQIIVVNDGSTDRTLDVARSYEGRVEIIDQENMGQGAARNAGLRVVRGEFVAFLDADDHWLPTFLSTCVSFLRKYPEAVAVSTGRLAGKWGRQSAEPRALQVASSPDNTGYLLDNFFETWAKYDHVRTGTVLIRRDVIEEAGPQLEIRISQDLEYWGYIATFGRWGFIPQALWVSNSFNHAVRSGWMRRYKKRRRMCPSVEDWEKRITPRLKPEDWPGFLAVRGRVAKGYAHNKLLIGHDRNALSEVRQYGGDFPRDSISKIMLWGSRTGRLGWAICCIALRLREHLKCFLVHRLYGGWRIPHGPCSTARMGPGI